MNDPVMSARARLAYWARKDVGNPEKEKIARRDFELAKLERSIHRALRETGPLSPAELRRLRSALATGAAAAA